MKIKKEWTNYKNLDKGALQKHWASQSKYASSGEDTNCIQIIQGTNKIISKVRQWEVEDER